MAYAIDVEDGPALEVEARVLTPAGMIDTLALVTPYLPKGENDTYLNIDFPNIGVTIAVKLDGTKAESLSDKLRDPFIIEGV